MEKHEFLRPRLCGKRFEDHGIPLEVLKDLSVLEEMVVEVAKWSYLEEHPDRQRSPRGFTEGVELKLTGVDDGSAVPVILLFVASPALFPPENQEYFEKGRDAILRGIDAAQKNGRITDHLPRKALGYFDRIGRSLRDDESIEFTSPTHQTPARLDRATRRKLARESEMKEFTEEVTVRGTVPEADKDKMTFEIQLIGGPRLSAPLAPQHKETILEAFDGYEGGVRVVLEGVGKYSRQERLRGIESVEHVSILEELDVPARLDELRGLKDGWLEGAGKAPNEAGLNWLSEAFEQNTPDDFPLPYVYPTPEGHVQAEWSLDNYEITLEINVDSHVGEWHGLDLATDEEESQSVDLDEASGWEWIVGRIKDMVEAPA